MKKFLAAFILLCVLSLTTFADENDRVTITRLAVRFEGSNLVYVYISNVIAGGNASAYGTYTSGQQAFTIPLNSDAGRAMYSDALTAFSMGRAISFRPATTGFGSQINMLWVWGN